jgi:hypothetical protein
MTIQYINTGSSSNKGDGDTLRTAFRKINDNFRVLETTGGGGGGSTSTSNVSILDNTLAPSIDIKSFSGTFTLPTNDSPINLFSFDKSVYQGASIDIFAVDSTNSTHNMASGYTVVWNGPSAIVTGLGVVSIAANGSSGNAVWDLKDANVVGDTINVRAYNASGVGTSNQIAWRAKVNLFRV